MHEHIFKEHFKNKTTRKFTRQVKTCWTSFLTSTYLCAMFSYIWKKKILLLNFNLISLGEEWLSKTINWMIQRWINEELVKNQKIQWNSLGEVSKFSWQHNNAQTIQFKDWTNFHFKQHCKIVLKDFNAHNVTWNYP